MKLMKNVILAAALAVSGVVSGQNDSLLTETQLYDVLYSNDTLGYDFYKTGDNDFEWSHGLL